MIDYEKLQLADKLAQAAIENGHESLVIEYNFYYGLARNAGHAIYLGNGDDDLTACDIDGIIDRLRELSQPEPKYNEGEQVWTVYENLENKVVA